MESQKKQKNNSQSHRRKKIDLIIMIKQRRRGKTMLMFDEKTKRHKQDATILFLIDHYETLKKQLVDFRENKKKSGALHTFLPVGRNV